MIYSSKIIFAKKKMPPKVKSKKLKTKRNVATTACWKQNDDGTFLLSIGSKKSNSNSELSDQSTGSEADLDLAIIDEYNNNVVNDEKKSQPVQNVLHSAIMNVPITSTLQSIQILKPNWLCGEKNGFNYKERQQIKRCEEMKAE